MQKGSNIDEKNFGIYLNKDKRGAYCNPNAPEKLIKYVTRAGRERKQELVSWGGAGVLEYSVESVIDQFYFAQRAHTRRGNFGRCINHALFCFSPEGEYAIAKNDMDVDQIARQMARDIFEQDHCQVVYGIHAPDNAEPHLHIHFAINAVNYRTGGKRRENKTQTRDRNQRLNAIISNELSEKYRKLTVLEPE